MKKKAYRASLRKSGFANTKVVVIIVAVVVVALAVAGIVYAVYNTPPAPTPPEEPIDATRQVVEKEPQSSGSSQSSALPQ